MRNSFIRMKKLIKVLIVDDSAVARDFLKYILDAQPNIHVVGTAKNGYEAIEFCHTKKPDIITMDIVMPGMNGIEATRKIMESSPVPIIFVTSSYRKSEVRKNFEALEAGGLVVLPKPQSIKHPGFESSKNDLIRNVILMSEVKVVRRRSKYIRLSKSESLMKQPPLSEPVTDYKIVAIGVSTGGPQILQKLFSNITVKLKVPILVVQHIPVGFIDGMVEWLKQTSGIPLRIARQGEDLLPNNVYFATSEKHMGVNKYNRIELKDDTVNYGITPSASYLFRSVNKAYRNKGIGILLSGMGKDGAEELLMMKESGALTIVQDRASSIVYGMPGEAVTLKAYRYIMSPEIIAEKLNKLLRV